MTTINSNIARVGNATSSEIVALTSKGVDKTSFGKPAKTYIAECNMERRLGRSITTDITARPLSWGNLVEKRVFNLLGTNYTFNSQETTTHPEIDYWAGSTDSFKFDEGKTVVDYKCPMTHKSFCNLVDPLYNGLTGTMAMNAIRNGWTDLDGLEREKHSDGEKFYWQLVSNACIHNAKYAELIIYMPYLSELQEIRDLTQEADPQDLYKYFWIANGNDEELPHLIEGGYYKNINIIRFEVPQADKDFLTGRVLMAGNLLQDFHKI
jgi:hypothetical protein